MVSLYSLNRKAIGAAGVLVACLILSTLLYMVFANNSKEDPTTPRAPRDASIEKVFIKDFYKFGDSINSTTRERVEAMLYNRVYEATPDLYTATINEGSYTKDTINQLTTQSFLVYVEPVKITYLVIITTSQGNDSIDIRCPPKEEQVDQSAECKVGAMI